MDRRFPLSRWIARTAAAVAALALAAVVGAAGHGALQAPSELRADGAESVDAWRRARGEAPARLRAHAAWCAEQKTARERLVAYEMLLALVPDDADARKALRYVKTKDGTWKRAKTDEPPASSADAAAEAARRLDEAVLPLRTSARRVFEDGDLPMGQREQAMDDRLAIDPDDPEVRTANGETKSGNAWRLDETLRARELGRELRAVGAEAMRQFAQPETGSATADETALAGPVAEVVWNAAVRVIGTEGTKEAAPTAGVVAASRLLWNAAFRADGPRVPDLRIFLFRDAASGHAAVDRDPTMTADVRAWVKTLGSAWRPKGNDCLIWAAEPANRVEFGLRQSVQVQTAAAFGVTAQRGWAYEGIGHWFSEVLLSAHHCTFVRRPEYADAGGADARAQRLAFLRASKDWMLAVRELSAKPEWPGVRSVLGKDVNGLAPDDLLVSYALARYVIEGRNDVVAGTFTDAGRGVAPDAWSEGALGLTVEGLDRRLRRWIREMGEK